MPEYLKKYDVFHSRYYHNIQYAGDFEMPVIRGTNRVPERLIRFSDAKTPKRDDPGAWVIPYELDVKIRPMWRNAFKYMDSMLAHPGIISWDYSMYRNMPFALQFWNCFKGRLLGALYEREGGECIPNIRPCSLSSLKYALDGLPHGGTVAMGTHGALGSAEDYYIFTRYVEAVTQRLMPQTVLVYGKAPEQVFYSALNAGVNVLSFPTALELAHRKKVC